MEPTRRGVEASTRTKMSEESRSDSDADEKIKLEMFMLPPILAHIPMNFNVEETSI